MAAGCKFITGVAFILERGGTILLHKRNIPGKIAFGTFALPGGTVEVNETVAQAACREAEEELGIKVREQDVSILHIVRLREKYDPVSEETMQILMLYIAQVTRWEGEPAIMEPDKHTDLTWFKYETLPENLFFLNKVAIDDINKKRSFSEHGWDNAEIMINDFIHYQQTA